MFDNLIIFFSCKVVCNLNCQNGGTCILVKGNPTCNCPPNYAGTTCQADLGLFNFSNSKVNIFVLFSENNVILS